MSAKGTGNLGIEKRIPERLRLFLIEYSLPAIWQKVKHFLFELYTYCLSRPYFRYRLKARSRPLKYLFVLSPMRSGSSLLVHLLNSNPAIEGYGESHSPYMNQRDLEKLTYRTAVIQKSFDFNNAQYVMDKVVRNHALSDSILLNPDVKFIFLLRDPAASFKSAAKLGQAYSVLTSYKSFANWFEYYQNRLVFMQSVARRISDKNRCLFIQYEDLLHQTDASLQMLQAFLKTQAAFSEQYRVSENTGRFRYGDPSEALRQGKILREQVVRKDDPVFEPEVQEQVYATYQECIAVLSRYAQTVQSPSAVSV